MRFKSVYKGLFICALLSVFIDYGATNIGFYVSSHVFEGNVFIRYLMRWMNPYLASSFVFLTTLALIIAAYKMSSNYLKEVSYTGSMKDVGTHLRNHSIININNLIVFVCVALCLVFIKIHITGFLSWLNLIRGFI